MRDQSRSMSAAVVQATVPASRAQLNVLAYVHLRNIHNSTGAGRVARQLTEHLALRSDVNLHVLADAHDHARVLPLVGEPWTKFTYHTFSSDTSRQQAQWFAFNKPLGESFWPDAQIVFCTGESYVPTRLSRLVVTLHDAAYFEQGAHPRDRSFLVQQLKWKFLFRRLVRRADMFHTVSDYSAERLAHFFPEMASRIRVVHNAVTPHFFGPVSVEGELYLDKAGLARRTFVLIPGGLHFRKNADLILEAVPLLLKRFPDMLLAVVNHSNPAYAERAAAMGERVRILGFVSDEALHSLYSAASLVWFPSRYEGFGLPVIEAMACGAPVVAGNTSSIPEVAGSAAMLVDPGLTKAHVEAIEYLLTDQNAREQLCQRGRIRAREFTWGRAAEKLKEQFCQLL